MKRFLGMILLCSLTGTTGYAQRAYIENNGGHNYYIVDVQGMPNGTYKTSAEVATQTLDSYGRVFRHNLVNGGHGTNPNVDAKLSPKFAVSPDNIMPTGAVGIPGSAVNWMEGAGWDTDANGNLNASTTPANTGCPMYAGPSGSETGLWRLPTHRELQFLWIIKVRLESLSGFTAFDSHAYWSATEYDANGAYNIYFGDGQRYSSGKTYAYRVRCVRDL